MTSKILDDLKALGYAVSLAGENIRLLYLGIGEHPVEAQPLIKTLKDHKSEVVEYLRQEQPLPYLDLDGSLVIPFNCDGSWHWWNGGQSIRDTVKEVTGWKH